MFKDSFGQRISKKLEKMLEIFRISNLFSSNLLKQIKLNDYPPVYYEDYLNNISFRNIRIRSANEVKTGHCMSSFFYWINNLLCIFAVVLFTISFFKDDEESLYYGNFNGYFMFENKLVLDITTGYILYFTYILKVFYTQFKIDDYEFGWIGIFRLFHKDIELEELSLNEKLASKLWRSTLALNNLTKILIYVEVASTVIVYIFVYRSLPDYFKDSWIGLAILSLEILLIFNIFKTFESYYFLFRIVCRYLSLRADYVLSKLNTYVTIFERKLNDRFVNDEINKLATIPFANDLNQEFDPNQIFKLLKEHDSICSLVKRYNYFWRFYLFATFFTMPIITGYFVFLLTFDSMYYIHRISLACIIVILISYFYLVTAPAVFLSSDIQKTIYPLKLLNKYRLPTKIKYKIETYLSRFEVKVSFDCYHMFPVTSETYLDFFFVAGSLLFLTLQLFSTSFQYQIYNSSGSKN